MEPELLVIASSPVPELTRALAHQGFSVRHLRLVETATRTLDPGGPACVVVADARPGDPTLLASWRDQGLAAPIVALTDGRGDPAGWAAVGATLLAPGTAPTAVARTASEAWLRDRAARRLVLGVCTVDLARRSLVRDGEVIGLTPKEAELLAYLAGRPGRPVHNDTLLRDVWGYPRPVVTRCIHNTMRRLRAKVERDPARPEHLLTEHGVGFRFMPLPDDGGTRELLSTTASPPTGPRPGRVPLPLDPFFGREDDLGRLAQAWTDGERLVTVVGTGGIGKTRLVVTWLRGLGESVIDATCFCPLDAVRTEQGVRQALAAGLGLDAAASQPTILEALGRGGLTALVLDNAEHVLEPVRALVAQGIQAAPSLRLIVTSRVPLGLPGEQVIRLGPLATPAAGALLDSRARAGGAVFDRAAEAHLDSVVAAVDGVPLALELAGVRCRLLGLATIARLLAQGRAPLSRRGQQGRHADMRATVAWSWDLLSPDAQALLAACSVFRGGFALEALASLTPSLDPGARVEALEELIEASLVEPPEGPAMRLRLLGPIRQFAASKVAEAGETAALAARHRDWAATLARGWALIPLDADGLREVLTTLPDLTHAWQGAVDAQAWQEAAHLALVCGHACMYTGIPAGTLDRVRQVREALQPGVLRAEVLVIEAFLCRHRGTGVEIPELLDQAWADLPPGERRVHARVLRLRAHQARREGRHQAAWDGYGQALALIEGQGPALSPLWVRLATDRMSVAAYLPEHWPSAARAAHEAISQTGSLYQRLSLAGHTYTWRYRQQDRARCAEVLEERLVLIGRVEAILGAPCTYMRIWNRVQQCLIARERGQLDEALGWAQMALALCDRAGSRNHRAMALGHTLWVHLERGDLGAAADVAGQATAVLPESGAHVIRMRVLYGLGVLRLRQGRPAEAAPLLEEAVALVAGRRSTGDTFLVTLRTWRSLAVSLATQRPLHPHARAALARGRGDALDGLEPWLPRVRQESA